MTHKYIVSVPGRAQPLCIEADSFKEMLGVEGSAVFIKDGAVVASLISTDLVANATCLPAFPELPQFHSALANCSDAFLELEPGMTCEPVRALESLPAQASLGFGGWTVPPFWPFLSGGALGFIGGFGLALSHAGVC